MKTTTKTQIKLFTGHLLILFLLILFSHNVKAQTLTLQDQQTLEPIPFANVSTKNIRNFIYRL